MSTFAELHTGPLPLLLPNAWDLTSALVLVADGYPAIGTTSFGVAASLGRPDGGRSTRDANLRLAAQLEPPPVHVSVDIEDGYSHEADQVAVFVAQLHEHDVAGVNVEDSTAGRLVDPQAFAAKVATIKEANPDVFLNVRVDTYWFHQDDNPEATLARATAYQDAGADGVFLPGATDPDLLRTITSALEIPVNILTIPGLTPHPARRARHTTRQHRIPPVPRRNPRRHPGSRGYPRRRRTAAGHRLRRAPGPAHLTLAELNERGSGAATRHGRQSRTRRELGMGPENEDPTLGRPPVRCKPVSGSAGHRDVSRARRRQSFGADEVEWEVRGRR